MSPALIQLLIQAGIQYGPGFVTDVIAVLKKPDPTLADVEALFANVKPYAAYGIPDVVPAPPAAPPTAPTA